MAHLHVPDATIAPDHRGRRPCADCGGMPNTRAHKVKDTTVQTKESRRRIGERD